MFILIIKCVKLEENKEHFVLVVISMGYLVKDQCVMVKFIQTELELIVQHKKYLKIDLNIYMNFEHVLKLI